MYVLLGMAGFRQRKEASRNFREIRIFMENKAKQNYRNLRT